MQSAALSEPGREAASQAPETYARAVWGALASGAFVAALAAWMVAMLAPLRALLLIEHGSAAIGLTLLGVVLAASPVLIWMAGRLLARGPNLLNPLWYWLYVIALGAAANTLALLFLRDSVVSVFALTALGFTAVGLAHRLSSHLPSWICALIFTVTGLGGEYAINIALNGTWPFTALDVGALVVIALTVLMRADGFERVRAMLKRPHPKAGVTFSAMHLIGLAEARQARAQADTIIVNVKEEGA